MPLYYPLIDKLKQTQAPSIGGTGIWDIPTKGKYTGFFAEISVDFASVNGQEVAKAIDGLSAVQLVVDGSREIIDVPAQALAASLWFEGGYSCWDTLREYGTSNQVVRLPIPCGRMLFDKKIGFIGENYSSAEIRITNNLSSTYWTAIAASVYSVKLGGDVGDLYTAGILERKKYNEHTTVQDETYYVDLPEEGNLRRCMLQSIPDRDSTTLVDKCDFRDLMYDLKLTSTGKDIVFFDQDFDALLQLNMHEKMWDLIMHGETYRAADKAWQWGGGGQLGVAGISRAADDAVSAVVPTISRDDDGSLKFEGYEADSPVGVLVKGFGPYHCAAFNYDKEPDLSDAIPLTDYKKMRLQIHTRNSSGAAGGVNRVITEVIRPK